MFSFLILSYFYFRSVLQFYCLYGLRKFYHQSFRLRDSVSRVSTKNQGTVQKEASSRG